ncbi:DUF2201 family putative metallopeptidase, partial [Streptomyces broussonetiae]
MPELAGVPGHEVAHLLRDHHGRAAGLPAAVQRARHRVNVAQDCEINDDLPADGLRMPDGCMQPRLFGLPAGRLFEMSLDRLPPDARAPDCGPGAHGRVGPWELPDCAGPARLGEVEAQALRRRTAEAMDAHRCTRGSLPTGR